MYYLKNYYIIVSLISLFCFFSCKTSEVSLNQKMIETEIKTSRKINQLLRYNDKVFFKRSTYATYAYVWIHTSNHIVFYEVTYNSIKKKTIENQYGYIINDKDSILITDNICNIKLDADIIGYAIRKDDDDFNSIAIPCDIEEFMNIEFSLEYKLFIQLQNDYSQILKSIH